MPSLSGKTMDRIHKINVRRYTANGREIERRQPRRRKDREGARGEGRRPLHNPLLLWRGRGGREEFLNQLRWDPTLREWAAYATHRQDRTFLPPAEYCPLCPTKPGGFPTEVPRPSI